MKERFAVLGSNSFSGASFIDYALRANGQAEALAVSRSPEARPFFLPYKELPTHRVRFHQVDMNHQADKLVALIRDFKPDYIVNFSAQGMVAESWTDPKQWFQTNCIAVLELAHRLTKEAVPLRRFVQISSPEVYGASHGESEETARYLPSTPYAASKAAGDLALYPFYLHKGLPVAYVRSTNVYGAYQQLYRIIPRTFISIRQGRKIRLHGGGSAVKSYVHIRDVCDAILRIARDGENGEAYHVSPDGGGTSIRDLVGKIAALLGKDLGECTEDVEDRLGQDKAYVISSEKIRRRLGWKPEIKLDEGLKEVAGWVERYYDELIKTPLDYVHKP